MEVEEVRVHVADATDTRVAAMAPSNADVVRANSDAFSRRDLDAMLELFAPDAVVRDRRSVGWGEFHGRDAVRAYYEGLFDNTEELYEDLTVASEAGDVVVASCRASARLIGVPDVMTFDYALKVTVDGGLITALEIYEDAAAAGIP
jgi:ketosteroid isomerase-like protein